MYIHGIHIFFIIFTYANCRDIFKFISGHKKIANFTMMALNGSNWVEYTYSFVKKNPSCPETVEYSNKLLVRVKNTDNFDCNKIQLDNTTYYDGFSVDFVKSLAENLNISIEFIDLDNDVNDANNSLAYKYEVDICDSHQKNTGSYFTINVGRYSMLYKTEKLHFNKDIFILTFAGTLWFIFLILMVILAICLRIATLQYSKIYPNYEPWSWVEITLWAIAAACQQGLGYVPNGFSSRLIFFLGYMMAYLLYTGFAAAITSVLLQNETPPDLKSISSRTSLVCLTNYNCLSEISFGHFKHTYWAPTMDELFDHLNIDGTIIMAPEIYVQFSRKKLNIDALQLSTITLKNTIFKIGFTIHNDRSKRKEVRQGVNRLRESGVLQNILRRNLLELPKEQERIEYGYSSAAFENVKSALYILFYGICASLLFIIAEHLYTFYKSKKELINQVL